MWTDRAPCLRCSRELFTLGLLPLVLHVDGAEFYTNTEFLVYSFASAFSEGEIWDTKFPCFSIPYDAMIEANIKTKVNETVALVMDWSLQSCASGKFPSLGPFGEDLSKSRKARAGQWLCDGWRACYWGMRSDMKALKETHVAPRSYLHNFICLRCYACKPHVNDALSYKNFHHNAPHRMLRQSAMT